MRRVRSLREPEHRQVEHPVAVLARVVVHEADRLQPDLRMAQQLLPDQLTRGAGTHDDHPLALVRL